jgi:hypothetical protein
MATKNQPAPPEPTPEEARRARQAAHRNRRPRHSASNPLVYDIPSHPPCGPKYVITNVPSPAEEIEVTYVEQ